MQVKNLENYLTQKFYQALTEQELEDIIAKAITEATNQGATGMKAMGIVMKIIQPQTVGRVDGTLLANKVKEKLS